MVRNVARNSTHVLFASVANASGTRSRAELPFKQHEHCRRVGWCSFEAEAENDP